MPGEDDIVAKLMEEHKDDFPESETDNNNETDTSGGDTSQDNTEDETDRTEDSDKDDNTELSNTEDEKNEDDTGESENGSAESNDSDDSQTEPVGEKKDAQSRIRQLVEDKKAVEAQKQAIEAEKEELAKKLLEKEEAEQKIRDLAEDPVYTVDDFLGTLDEKGEPLTDGEATARFRAWEADYKLRQFQKQQVLKDQQDALISLQSETKDAFTKFPEFNNQSDRYDKELAEIANEAFRAGLIYSPGHEDDDNYIIGSRINPGELLEKLHNLRKETTVTKVNNLGDNTGPIVGSQQVTKKTTTYAPTFRGQVDAELDKLINKGNK